MIHPESEIYQGIVDRLRSTAPAVETYYTDAGHVKPTEIRIYNRDYEDQGEAEKRNSGKIPFKRPAVFVEFQDYELPDIGGYLAGYVPIVLHVVQDIYVTGRSTNTAKQTAHKDLLKYPTLIQQLIHKHRLDNTIFDAGVRIQPDHDHKNLLVHKVNVRTKVRIRVKDIYAWINGLIATSTGSISDTVALYLSGTGIVNISWETGSTSQAFLTSNLVKYQKTYVNSQSPHIWIDKPEYITGIRVELGSSFTVNFVDDLNTQNFKNLKKFILQDDTNIMGNPFNYLSNVSITLGQ